MFCCKSASAAILLSAVVFPAFAADLITKAPPLPPAPVWTTTFDSEVRYSSWERTAGNVPGRPNQHGSQVYVPFSASTVGLLTSAWRLELMARGGYVSTSRSAQGFSPVVFPGFPFATGNSATATDTILNGTVTYLAIDGVQPYYSLNLNLPTGQTILRGFGALSRTDPDLVDVAAFGEGFNNAHTLGVNIPFDANTVLTLNVGYTSKGAYTRDSLDPATLLGTLITLERYNPGDSKSVGANYATTFGKFSVNLAGSATFSSPDAVNSIDTFKNGKAYFASGSASYRWDDMWTSSANVSYSHTSRLFIADPVTGVLLAEPQNSNSDLVRAGFTQSYAWQSYVFNATAGYMRRFQNEYNSLVQAFVPARTKWTVGGGAKYVATKNLSLQARAEHFWINEDVKPDFSGIGGGLGPVVGLPIKYEGWQLAAGGTYTF